MRPRVAPRAGCDPRLIALRLRCAGATVKFMMDAMRKAGCAVDRRFFKVEACEGNVVGGFRPPDGVRTLYRRAWPRPRRA